jgi:hypothetical protein
MIGVNTNLTDPNKLKETIVREQLNWRTFTTSQKIKDDWNDPGTPTYYVIDHQGVIRHKWFGSPGEDALEEALDELIQAVESTQ